ncbi:uncharacterized protein TNCV_4386851 [Trichonephila clavipes]|nr:uncharacterized protein TNCV_4386851 [Trichonephila clavipes]
MITDQLKRRVPGDVREQFIDDWVKSIVPGDLADKLDEYEKRHLARECPKNTRKTPPHNARSNIITAKGTELEKNQRSVDTKCGQTSIKAVIDTGAQISVLREDLIDKGCGEGEGTIQIISAFGEKEIAALKLFNLKIDDGKHGSVPIMCAVSKKLVNNMLISTTAYEILLENVQLFDFGNQRDFESTKDKDIEFRKETKNETRIREAKHKEEKQARLKAEVNARLKDEEETKAVEERQRMEEEIRMKERIALEEVMRLKKERCLEDEQIRHVQEEHKMRTKEEQKCLPEEGYAVEQPVAVEEEKGLSRDSSNVPPISAEDETYKIKEKPKLPKRKLKELSRMSVTKLQRKVNLKASNNIVLVPQYWSFKCEYSQNKREIGKLAWKLLGFIKRIDIGKALHLQTDAFPMGEGVDILGERYNTADRTKYAKLPSVIHRLFSPPSKILSVSLPEQSIFFNITIPHSYGVFGSVEFQLETRLCRAGSVVGSFPSYFKIFGQYPTYVTLVGIPSVLYHVILDPELDVPVIPPADRITQDDNRFVSTLILRTLLYLIACGLIAAIYTVFALFLKGISKFWIWIKHKTVFKVTEVPLEQTFKSKIKISKLLLVWCAFIGAVSLQFSSSLGAICAFIFYFLKLISDYIRCAAEEERRGPGVATTKWHFHFTLVLLSMCTTALVFPGMIAWVKGLQYSFQVPNDPYTFPCVSVVLSCALLWQLPSPSFNRVAYKKCSYVVHIIATLVTLYGIHSIYRLLYYICFTFIIICIQQTNAFLYGFPVKCD